MVVDLKFFFCSHCRMTRLNEHSLALHLEVALAGASPALLDGLTAADRRQRNAAAADMARHLAERLRCFDIRDEDASIHHRHPSLFPEDLSPIG